MRNLRPNPEAAPRGSLSDSVESHGRPLRATWPGADPTLCLRFSWALALDPKEVGFVFRLLCNSCALLRPSCFLMAVVYILTKETPFLLFLQWLVLLSWNCDWAAARSWKQACFYLNNKTSTNQIWNVGPRGAFVVWSMFFLYSGVPEWNPVSIAGPDDKIDYCIIRFECWAKYTLAK